MIVSPYIAIIERAVNRENFRKFQNKFFPFNGVRLYYNFNNVSVILINNKEFVFWDDFCSKYPDWVGPNTVANYLGETTDHAHAIHAVHFR